MQVLESLLNNFNTELKDVNKIADLLNLKAKYIGKQGPMADVMKNLKDATPEEKKTIGAKANEVKNAIEGIVAKKMLELELQEINQNLEKDRIDYSLTDSVLDKGLQSAGFHPVTIIQQEIEDIFISMGFEVLDGPHIEDEYHKGDSWELSLRLKKISESPLNPKHQNPELGFFYLCLSSRPSRV
jgi:phenylalanyl-tRNA synthetase alpha chain